MIIPILITVIILATLIAVILVVKGNKGDKQQESEKAALSKKIQRKGKSAIIREAEKKLIHDPHNVEALETIGEISYSEKNWEKVWTANKTLYDIAPAHSEVDVAKSSRRMGIAAYNLGKFDDAINSLMIAVKREPENFEGNFYLGASLYQKGVYDKAIYCLKKSKILMPDNSKVTELLGMSLYKSQKFRESLPYLKKVLDENPDNK